MDVFPAGPIAPHLREPLRAALRGERSEWPRLTQGDVRALIDQGVAPLVYATQPLPELRPAAIGAAAMEPSRTRDLASVLRDLAEHGVDVLIMKGSALAYQVYGQPELRPRGDVDLLVAREKAPRAIDRMLAAGFNTQATSGDTHALRQVTLSRQDGNGIRHDYDLHWAVANTPVFASALLFENAWPEAVPIPAIAPEARGFSLVDALLLACIHRVAHHHDDERLIWLVDVALLRDRMTTDEHRLFWERAAAARVIGACERSIELANEWMSRPPQHLSREYLSPEECEGSEPSRVFLDRDLTYGGEMLANFRALPWKARLQRVWHLTFPPAEFVLQSFGSRSRAALPWLYVRRGARGVARLFRRTTG